MSSFRVWRVNVVVRSLYVRMSSSLSYESAIVKLNSLQSNQQAIERSRKQKLTGEACTNLADMRGYLRRAGVAAAELDALAVVHVAGTKGKGSTCAMVESILRQHGVRTGFFSSPHLVSVRERVRLDGRPLARDQFAAHAHAVFDRLHDTQEYPGDMPTYFAFLTVLALRVFVRARAAAAVLEVGIGGADDFTNVLRKVAVVGISSLGLDHVSLLGPGLEQIAAHKAGVMKAGCVAYTAPQPPRALAVLRRRAAAVGCELHVAPDYSTYEFPAGAAPAAGGAGGAAAAGVFRVNASLALQLAHAWLRAAGAGAGAAGAWAAGAGGAVPAASARGLREYRWLGRFQVLPAAAATYCLDGAHTPESARLCAAWYRHLADRYEEKALIFSATGERNGETLLEPLKDIPFKNVYFVNPTAYSNKQVSNKSDNFSLLGNNEKSRKHAEIWKKYSSGAKIHILESVSDALFDIQNSKCSPYVLVTGSLYLVGAALSILDPNLS